MKKYIFSILIIALMSVNLSAQVITRKTSIENINEISRFVDKIKIDVKTMPKIDIDKLLLEDEEDKKANVPFRFGSAFNVNYNLENSGTWIDIGS